MHDPEDARRAALKALELGGGSWRLDAVLALTSYYLGEVEAAKKITRKQRDELLSDMTNELAAHVLMDNYRQSMALTHAEAQSGTGLDECARFIRKLERGGLSGAERMRTRQLHQRFLSFESALLADFPIATTVAPADRPPTTPLTVMVELVDDEELVRRMKRRADRSRRR